MSVASSSPGPSTTRTSGRTRIKSQRAQESEDTQRALARARERARLEAEGILPPPPKKKKVVSKKTKKEREVWCICKSDGEDGRAMIECGHCGDWYHFDCVNLSEDEAERIHTYICADCQADSGEKTIREFGNYDISTIPSPTPPPGVPPLDRKRKSPVKKARPKTKLASSKSPVGDSETSSSDDDASDAELGSDSDGPASVNSDAPAPKVPISKRPRLPPTIIRKRESVERKPSISSPVKKSTGPLPPARAHVLNKMTEVIKGLFGEEMTPEAALKYAADVEAAIWAGFKEVVGGKEIVGGRYKTQFNLLQSSLPKARSDLLESITSFTLNAGNVAALTSADLASAERLEEIERAKETVRQQTVKAREITTEVRFVRDGFERVEDVREKELQALRSQEEAARVKERRDSIMSEVVVEPLPTPTPQKEEIVRSPVQMHDDHDHDNTAAEVLSSFQNVESEPNTPISPMKSTFAMTSAWGDAKADDVHEHDYSFENQDQSALDLSDIIDGVDEVEEVDVGPSEMDVLREKPAVWSGGIANPADASPITPPIIARHISTRGTAPNWAILFPQPIIAITGRVPIASSLKFLSETRLSPVKELITVVFTLSPSASIEEKTRWAGIVDFHLGRDRHAVYLPHGDRPPPGAAKEIYLIPMRPSDPSPDFTGLIDGYSLPNTRDEPVILGIAIVNRDAIPLRQTSTSITPQSASISAPAPSAQQLQNDKLQALMASLNPATLQNLPSPAPVIPTPPPAAVTPIHHTQYPVYPTPSVPGPSYPPYVPPGNHSPVAPYGWDRGGDYPDRGGRYSDRDRHGRGGYGDQNRRDRERSPDRRRFDKPMDNGWASRGRGR